jgi:hypothetical protein
VRFDLPPRAFAHWDEARHAWSVEPGEREILVGSSSHDIRGTMKIVLPAWRTDVAEARAV